MLLKPASDFRIVHGDSESAQIHSDIVRSNNGLGVALAIISTLSSIQMCSHLILVLLHWVGMAQSSTKYPQFHKRVFLIGGSVFLLSRSIMIAWTVNAVFDMRGIIFDLLTYWSLWMVVVVCNLKCLSLITTLSSAKHALFNVENESASDALEYPDVFFVVSVFREQVSTLIDTIDSIIDSDYPKNKIRLVLAFDENSDGLEYVLFLNRLNLFDSVFKYKYGETEYRGVRILIGKFVHTGKQSSQRYGVELIRRVYGSDRDISSEPILIFCDSDVRLDEKAILNGSMKLYKDQRLVAVVGTKHITAGSSSLLEMIESMDCMEREIFDFPMQRKYNCFYGTICALILDLPGQIIFIRFAAFRDIELRYFANLDGRLSIAAYNRTKFADHLLLQNCKRIAFHVLVIVENYGAHRLCYSPSVKVCHRSSHSWSDFLHGQRRHYLGLIASTVGLLGNRRLCAEVKKVYWINTWMLISRASQLTVFSLLLTCLFSQTYSIVQLCLLFTPFLVRCLAFVFFSIKQGKPLLAVIYPVYNILIRTVLDFLVLIFSLVSWNVQIWCGYRTRVVSVREKSLKNPAFDKLFQKVKQISLNKDEEDDEELLEKPTKPKNRMHQFIAESIYKPPDTSKDEAKTDILTSDFEMQQAANFGNEVFDAINSLGKDSRETKDGFGLNVERFL